MPKIVGNASRVVDDGHGLTIDELVGNVASSEDTISIAHVRVTAPTSEPWLTLDYDEWMCVMSGKMTLMFDDGASQLVVNAGQTVFIAKGERFKPEFPEGDCVYVPVCLPAFRPDRCIREEGGVDSEVSKKLKALHSTPAAATPPPAAAAAPPAEVLYHMCEKALWDKAVAVGDAYYPPTYEADGFYTHATAVPSRLITTANHFYTASVGDWVCLRLSRSALRRGGIYVRDEEALPVGDQKVGDDWGSWICPHIIGGIPLSAVNATFPMVRDGPKFLHIAGIMELSDGVKA
eukprot:CAMPEP_0197616712 /NCGR_PEP_ID=MMETSP1326-20131121/60667_1 /TAXON_ID=1155430 /ORGANISM="Genus nov. species nov., Strain RCC2288" /LENGTH=290 /DNA_ID=CAMNT_0043185599 /DNA_START=61 /DNA_END=933 /DNA_ORIENTATION=-